MKDQLKTCHTLPTSIGQRNAHRGAVQVKGAAAPRGSFRANGHGMRTALVSLPLSRSLTESLIDAIKNYPELFDKMQPRYKDASHKKQISDHVAKELVGSGVSSKYTCISCQ